MKRVFLILISVLSLSNHAQGQEIDLSSVDSFFIIKDKISSGKAINESDWADLFNTKGYKISARSSARKDIIREMMLLAYDEELKAKKDSILNISIEENIKKPYDLLRQMTLFNFIDYSKNDKKIKAFRNEYDFISIPKLSAKRLKSFLINPIDSLISSPSINFLCYEPDAQSKGDDIVCDFNLFFKQAQAERINFIAHETFHKYRCNFVNSSLFKSNVLLQEIDKLQDEGIADLIDKKENLLESLSGKGLPELFIKQYIEAYKNTPKILQEFDSLVNSCLNKQISNEQLESKLNNFFLSGGHPNGYYMARLIEKAGLRKEMLNKFYSPVDFIKIYNQAAQKGGGYVFSNELIAYLETLK